MLYTIDLQGMEFHAFHGCYDLEQRVGNRFEVTLSITTELGGIAAHDAVEEAVNYLTVYEIVRERMAVTRARSSAWRRISSKRCTRAFPQCGTCVAR